MVQLMPLHPKTPSSLASFKSRPVYLTSTDVPRLSLKEAVKWCIGCSIVIVVVNITGQKRFITYHLSNPGTAVSPMCVSRL